MVHRMNISFGWQLPLIHFVSSHGHVAVLGAKYGNRAEQRLEE